MRSLGVTSVTVALAAGVVAIRLLAPVPLEVLDRKLLDFRHVLRGPLPTSGDVVIVGIDQASLSEVGRWPWPRAKLAMLIDRLSQDGAAVIALDVVLDQPEPTIDLDTLAGVAGAQPDRTVRELLPHLRDELGADARLAGAIERSQRVVLGHFFEFGGAPSPTLAAEVSRLPELSVVTLPGAGTANAYPLVKDATRAVTDIPAFLAPAAGAGHINFAPDPDGLYRRAPLAVRAGNTLLPALGVEVVRRHLGGGVATVTLGPEGVAGLRVGGREVAVDGAGQLWVNFLGPQRTIPHVSAADVLAERIPRDRLAGKIVLVGFTAAGFDEVPTPFAAVVPGVELQATVVDNMLHQRSLRHPWWVVPFESTAVLLIGLVVGLLLRWLPTGWAMAAVAAVALGYLWGTQRLFTTAGLALGGVYPLGAIVLCALGGAVYEATVEGREKRKIRLAFSHYVNREVADLIASDPGQLRLGGERRELTILFSDIRGFTSIAEGLRPEVLGELLNEYLGAMTSIVFRHQGLLDKYIGDAVMAFWGAPVAVPDHAKRCCHAALDMLDELARLQARWRAAGLPVFDIRVGISTGDAIVGNFGSAQRFSYTAVGNDVNLASRLEALNKEYGTWILLSGQTRHALGDEFVCREIDQARVRGRAHPIPIYELLGRRAADRDGILADRAARFEAAVDAARHGSWAKAISRLEILAAAHPDDHAVGPLLARCRARLGGPAEGRVRR